MFARVTTLEGTPDRIAEGARLFREEVIPWLRDATGFRGGLVLVDREGERGLAVTFWATEEAMRDPAVSGGALRDEVVAGVGTPISSIEYYEVLLAEALALDDE